uniref:Uncharacterized protein n=1 Tax=Arundo donax TaxID=35708 RepID=A0A0A9I155_ARUDO
MRLLSATTASSLSVILRKTLNALHIAPSTL